MDFAETDNDTEVLNQLTGEVKPDEYDVQDPTFKKDEPEKDASEGDKPQEKNGDTEVLDKAEETEKVEFDTELVSRAKSVGLDEDEINEFENQNQLERHVRLSEKHLFKAGKDHLENIRNQNQLQDTKPVETKQEVPDDSEFDIEFSEDLSPEIVDAFTKVKDKVRELEGQIRKYKGIDDKVEQVSSRLTAREAKDYEALVDEEFSSLGKEYEKDLGNGPARTMKLDSSEFQNRVKVLEHVSALQTGYELKGMKSPSFKSLFKTAVTFVIGDKSSDSARNKLKDEIKNQGKHIVRRPSGSIHNNGGVPGRDKAINSLKKWYQDRGESIPDVADEEF